jgi:hypothetical protein
MSRHGAWSVDVLCVCMCARDKSGLNARGKGVQGRAAAEVAGLSAKLTPHPGKADTRRGFDMIGMELAFTRTLVFPINLTTSPTYDPGSCRSCSSSRSIRTAATAEQSGKNINVNCFDCKPESGGARYDTFEAVLGNMAVFGSSSHRRQHRVFIRRQLSKSAGFYTKTHLWR